MTCYVYFIECDITKTHKPVKVGVANDPEYRLAELQCGNPYPIKIKARVALPDRDTAFKFEAFMHNAMRIYYMRGEWFDVHPLNIYKAIRKWNKENTPELQITDFVYG